MPIGKKKAGRSDKFVRTGGAMGDPTMEELDDFNRSGAGVDASVVRDVGNSTGGDPNAGVHLLKRKKDGVEDGNL